MTANTIVSVLLPVPLEGTFSYLAPPEVPLEVGQLVRVSFGSRMLDGIVVTLEGSAVPHMKWIEKTYDLPLIPTVLLDFLGWMARYTMSPEGAILKMCLPDKLVDGSVLSPGLPPPKGHVQLRVAPPPSLGSSAASFPPQGTLPEPHKQAQGNLGSPLMPQLTPSQEAGAIALKKHLGAYHVAVLDGVTGSGKTEVYFDLMDTVLSQGGQVLVLLPEIALSAQWLERFQVRFGYAPEVWHSEITPAKQRKVWHGVLRGEASVVVGARSSLFLPFSKLQLILVDEEHDPSYKQEEGVIYNARDMAIVRAKGADALVVLASATPSLETMENVASQRYSYISLPQRFNQNQMPSVQLVDMRGSRKGKQSWISLPLRTALLETYGAGEQSLLFLNRRGFAPVTLCGSCGYRFACPDCAAWLVKHKHVDHVQCHHCGYTAPIPSACPACHEPGSLMPCGPGVERIADEVQALLPEARILIMSSDKLLNLKAVQEAVTGIQKGEVDVIVGTQLIAKGHDFKGLSCVGVIDGDLGLIGGDLRSGERTFQLLMQVAGRAGRHHTLGRVFLQTYDPESALMQALARGDRDAFMGAEMAERKAFGWPPYGRLASLILSSREEALLEKCVRVLARKAPTDPLVRVLGPAPAALFKVRGKYRWRFLIKTPKALPPQAYLSQWLGQVKLPRSITCQVDIDPQSFF